MKISAVQNYSNQHIIQHTISNPIKVNLSSNSEKNGKNTVDLQTNIPYEVFRRNLISERLKLLKPIKTEEEYEYLIKIFKNSDKINISTLEPEFSHHLDFSGYENADYNLLGLVPYCGTNDTSEEINCWLTGRFLISDEPLMSDDEIIKIISALDYSLNKLDEKYGKYEGFVYRAGFFNPNTDKQYYSASDSIDRAMDFSPFRMKSQDTSFSIIKVKNGHKIVDFQQETNSPISNMYANNEREILIDRKSKFRKIKKEEYTKEDKELITKVLACSLYKNYNETSRIIRKHPNLEILDRITIWEEI